MFSKRISMCVHVRYNIDCGYIAFSALLEVEQLCLITKNISAILIYILMWNLEPEPKFLAQEYLQIHQHWKKTYQNAIHFMNILQLTRKPVFTYSPYIYSWSIFSSPELKAQVSFSDHLSSVVCLSVCLSVRLSVCPSVCKLFTFSSSSPEPLGQFQPYLAQSILGWRGLKFLTIQGSFNSQKKRSSFFSLIINIMVYSHRFALMFIDWNCFSDKRCGPWTFVGVQYCVFTCIVVMRNTCS